MKDNILWITDIGFHGSEVTQPDPNLTVSKHWTEFKSLPQSRVITHGHGLILSFSSTDSWSMERHWISRCLYFCNKT